MTAQQLRASPPALSILAAIDFSDAATLVVQEALDAAWRRGAQELHFLHVHHGDQNPEQRRVRSAELLEWLGARLGAGAGSTHLVAHELQGDPAHLIVDLARDLAVDLVIVGTHGRPRLERFFLGSVASSVVRDAPCPVLVVRPKLAVSTPEIAPACPDCLAARARSRGAELWCEQHREKHGRRHTYYDPRASTWSTQRITI
jgi:nucleotide-binding universal stress UspA family protein